MRRLLSRFGSWLNRKLNIIADAEDSRYYDLLDQELRRKGQ